jgi:hypothetical protein
VETFAAWAAVLVVEAAATVGTVGESVVTCGHKVPHGTGVAKSREIPTDAGIVVFLGPGGPVGRDVRQSVPRRPHTKPRDGNFTRGFGYPRISDPSDSGSGKKFNPRVSPIPDP